MRITVIGCGRWGSFIAKYLCDIGHRVTLYGRESSANMRNFIATRKNSYLTLPENVALSTELGSALESADIIVISIDAQGVRALTKQIAGYGAKNKVFILCMKGLEIETGNRLSQIASGNFDPSNKIAVWLGPGHVQDFCRGIPNYMVIDSEDEILKRQLAAEFSSSLIRFYYGNDLIGNEIGAAAKNVVGIAAGFLDGLELSSLKGSLMSRGTLEISRLIKALGGSEFSAYGLCHLGDYEATVFSQHSHNRRFGEMFVKGEKFDKLAEGYYTVRALKLLSERTGTELPICEGVYDVLYNATPFEAALERLFARSTKTEFY